MIKKISRKEAEDVIKKHFGIKEVGYFGDRDCEGYGEAYVDYEFIEGDAE